ncbi:hypothetical protein PAXINDRAFT_80943 [Paxillus involutus ATCC 200175]|uniref:WD40 repeat-like protein n=1 Tax=Paxillus involutus ATCC 200175 TaxID=664439 RepID=A0A0C9TD80_PAXIN|nr:hypothetical protein PAXINDRAFT_80943 [Paxillus involutus ATCC 200175]
MSNASKKPLDFTEKPLTTLLGHEDEIWGIAYIPQADGKRVITCSDDKTVRIWNVESGEQEGTSMEHEEVVYGLAVTRNGERIVSGGMDMRIKVWDVATHELIEEWESHTRGSIWSIALSPDDQLAASGDSHGKIVIREMEEGGEIRHAIETGGEVRVNSLCFSPNGEKLACVANKDAGGNYAIQIFDVESGELILGSIHHEHWVRCVIWSFDGSQLFSASDDHTIRCWNSETAEPIGQPWTGHTDMVTWLSLSPDGKRLASTSVDQTVRFWDVHSGDPVARPLQHDDHLMKVTFSPSGEFVASGTVRIWDVISGEQEGTSMKHEGMVYGLAVTRDGQMIVSGGVNETIKVWDVKTHELIEEWGSHTRGIPSIALCPDDQFAASGDWDGKIVLREMKEGGEIKHSIETGGEVNSLCFSPDGEKIACTVNKEGDGNYAIQVYDVESGELILGSINHEDWARCVVWSFDGSRLFSVSNDHIIKCWNSETAEPIGTTMGRSH